MADETKVRHARLTCILLKLLFLLQLLLQARSFIYCAVYGVIFHAPNSNLMLLQLMVLVQVIYHIDDEDTPYLVKLPVGPERVTLADFKNVLNRPNYKFFFKVGVI